MSDKHPKQGKWRRVLTVLLVVAVVGGGFVWWKLFREPTQVLANNSMEEYNWLIPKSIGSKPINKKV